MREYNLWSISLGRWDGAIVRLHIFFLLFTALTLYLSWLSPVQHQIPRKIDSAAVISIVCLLLSVIWREFWHYQAAKKMRISIQEIVLMPWGGSSSMSSSFKKLSLRRFPRLDKRESSEEKFWSKFQVRSVVFASLKSFKMSLDRLLISTACSFPWL